MTPGQFFLALVRAKKARDREAEQMLLAALCDKNPAYLMAIATIGAGWYAQDARPSRLTGKHLAALDSAVNDVQ